MYDVAIIGGGIIGASAAAFLAGAGASVVLFEQAELAAAASGRNSGVLQHPFDEVLGQLHAETLALYRELATMTDDFDLRTEPAGLLLVSHDLDAVARAARMLAAEHSALQPVVVAPAELQRIEPALAGGVGACRLETGYPVVPAAATHSFARRAQRAGATIRLDGGPVRVRVEGSRALGVVTASGEPVAAGSVLVAGGPWTPALVPGWSARPPIVRTWGVVVSVRLDRPPGGVLEELGINPAGTGESFSFSLVTAGGASSVGSTFLGTRPSAEELVDRLLARGASFVPAIGQAETVGVRLCARPVSFDGRPLVGPVAGVAGLFVCAGHGPWGISTGPATARLVSEQILGRPERADAAPELAASRWPAV